MAEEARTSSLVAGQAPSAGGVRAEHLAALAVTLVGLGVAIHLAVQSEGAFYHDDDINHYLFAVKAWDSPLHRWHLWGRPGYTIPTMFVAHFSGVSGCRIFSALQTALVAFLAYLIARRIGAGTSAILAPALVWLQPLAMTLSLTTLTETPAAVYLTLAVWLYLRGNFAWSCASASAMVVTRYETAALTPILFGAVAIRALRRAGWKIVPALRTKWLWGSLAALAWAPLAYLAAAWIHQLPPEASPLGLAGNHFTDEYGQGTWYHYLERWPVACGAGMLAIAGAGIIGAGLRCWLPTAMGVGLVALHTALYRYGLFASGGYERFLVAECGLVAAVAAAGANTLLRASRPLAAVATIAVIWEFVRLLEDRMWLLKAQGNNLLPIPHPAAILGCILIVAVGAFLVTLFRPYRPVRIGLGLAATTVALLTVYWQAKIQIRPLNPDTDPHRIACAEAVRTIAGGPHQRSPAIAGHVLVGLIRPNTVVGGSAQDELRMWLEAPPGTLFFWDNKYTGQRTDASPQGPLHEGLERLGERIFCTAYDYAEVEVFLRGPDGEE